MPFAAQRHIQIAKRRKRIYNDHADAATQVSFSDVLGVFRRWSEVRPRAPCPAKERELAPALRRQAPNHLPDEARVLLEDPGLDEHVDRGPVVAARDERAEALVGFERAPIRRGVNLSGTAIGPDGRRVYLVKL